MPEPTSSTSSFTVRLPAHCVEGSFGDPKAPCRWRIEKWGDVIWCDTHGGVNETDIGSSEAQA